MGWLCNQFNFCCGCRGWIWDEMLTGVPAGVSLDTWEEGYPSTQKCGYLHLLCCLNCTFLPWDGRCKYSLQLKLSSVDAVGDSGLIFIMPVMNSLLLVKMGKPLLGQFYPKAQRGRSGVPVELENTGINPPPLLLSACYGACICRNLRIVMWFSFINALSSGLFSYSCFTVFPG